MSPNQNQSPVKMMLSDEFYDAIPRLCTSFARNSVILI